MNDPFELPSLEEIEEMDKHRSQAIESLEISNGFVKCQNCAIALPIVGKLPTPYRNRITLLKHRIDWIQSHPRLKDSINNIKQLGAFSMKPSTSIMKGTPSLIRLEYQSAT